MPKSRSSCLLTPRGSQTPRALGGRAHRRARGQTSLAVGLCFLLFVLLIPALIGAQPATARYVSRTDPTCAGNQPCYPSIQAAVRATVAGDTVRILAGRYHEQVLIEGKNNTDSATEGDRIIIEADPQAALGSVILVGSTHSECEAAAIRIKQSRFVTVRGLTITRNGGLAIRLVGGASQNHAIHIERNRVYRNLGTDCDSAIRIERGNAATLIVNNLIYGNGSAGVTIMGAGGPYYIVNNTIHDNGGSGIRIDGDARVLVINNAITANGGTRPRYGIRVGEGVSNPAAIQLLHNLVCGNRRREIDGAALDDTDAGNLTPTGTEGLGVGTSPGCDLPTTVYAEAAGADGQAQTVDDNFTPNPASPAIGQGLDPRTLGLGPGLDALFEADYVSPDARLAPGSGEAFDIGAIARNSAPISQPPRVTIVSPPAGGFLRGAAAVRAQATAADAVTGLALHAGSQSLTSSLQPATPAPATTATASWQTATVPDGVHTLTAAARDSAGRTTTASRLAIVDNTPPETQITSGPVSTTGGTAQTFTFSGSDNLTARQNLVFAWRVDGQAFTPFSPSTTASPAGLTAGAHTFQVKAKDQAGNEDPTPASRTFTVSSQPAPPPSYALTITRAGTGAGTTTGASTYAAGAAVTMTAAPASGSTFAGWSGDAVCAPTFTMPSRTVACTATFNVATPPPGTPSITLTYTGLLRDRVGQNNGALAPDGLMDGTFVATFGSAGTLTQLTLTRTGGLGIWDTISTNSYWALGVAGGLDRPLLNGPGDSIRVALTADQALTLFASEAPRLGLTLFTGGSTFTLTATFADGRTVAATTTIPLAPTPSTYALTITTAGTGVGTATGAGTYAAGAAVTLTATPASGATFVGWSGDAACAPTFVMPSRNVTCTASFSGTAAPAPSGTALTWAQRAAQPGVLMAVPLTSSNDLVGRVAAGDGATPVYDGAANALRIDSPANTTQANGGAWRLSVPWAQQFGTDARGAPIGSGTEFWVQFDVKYSAGFRMNTPIPAVGGWTAAKTFILGQGDAADGTQAGSCTPVHLVMQGYLSAQGPGFPILYQACPDSGAYQDLYTPLSNVDTYLQPEEPNSRNCLYRTRGPVPPCITYGLDAVAGDANWSTVTVHVKLGPLVGQYWTQTLVELWINQPGAPATRVIRKTINYFNDAPATQRLGKLWLLNYQTGRDPAIANPTWSVWYRHVLWSAQPLLDPIAGVLLGASGPAPGPGPGANTWTRVTPNPSSRILCHNYTVDSTPTAQATPMSREYGGIRLGGGYLFDFGGAHSGHPCNDVELYDIAQNVWRQMYAPEAVPAGHPDYPGVYFYGGASGYNTVSGRPWTEHTAQEFSWYPARSAFLGLMISGTWEYRPDTNTWTRVGEGPGGQAQWLATVRNLGVGRFGTFYDPVTNRVHAVVSGDASGGTWTWTGTAWAYKGPLPASGWSEVYSAYLSTIQRHLVKVHNRWWHYNPVGAGAWVEKTNVPAIDAFDFDTTNGVLIAVQHRGDPISMWAYAPLTDTWTSVSVPAMRPVQTTGLPAWGPLMVYDAARNLFWFLAQTGGGSGTGGSQVSLWAYRYR